MMHLFCYFHIEITVWIYYIRQIIFLSVKYIRYVSNVQRAKTLQDTQCDAYILLDQIELLSTYTVQDAGIDCQLNMLWLVSVIPYTLSMTLIYSLHRDSWR